MDLAWTDNADLLIRAVNVKNFFLWAKAANYTGYTPSRVAVIEEEEKEACEPSQEYYTPPIVVVSF